MQARTAEPKFHPNHRIEQHVKIYLRLSADGTRWEIDPITDDGWPLDGLEDGPTPKESDCECGYPKQCWEVHNYAHAVTLPTGTELFALLSDYYLGR